MADILNALLSFLKWLFVTNPGSYVLFAILFAFLPGPVKLFVLMPILAHYWFGWTGVVVYGILLLAFLLTSPYRRGFIWRYRVKPFFSRFRSRSC